MLRGMPGRRTAHGALWVLLVGGVGVGWQGSVVGADPVGSAVTATRRASLPELAPLTYVRFLLPEGVRVTVYPGTSAAQLYPGTVRLGLRPGYRYRFELSNLPADLIVPPETQTVLYPEVTVHGSLVSRGGIRAEDFPVPLKFSREDLRQALNGAVIVKYVYLEDPSRAIATATTPESPLELPDADEPTARQQAMQQGRLLVTIRLGNRIPTAAELRQGTIDHTVLLPQMSRLPAPPCPPLFPVWVIPPFDPLAGPRPPQEECLINGGDRGAPLGIGPRQQLGGLDVGDVAVEYTRRQQRYVTTSNPVPLCAPRFVIRRVEWRPQALAAVHHAALAEERNFPLALKQREQPRLDFHYERLQAVQGQLKPSLYLSSAASAIVSTSQRLQAVAQVSGLKVNAVLVAPEQLTAYPTLAPLTVSKQIDPPGPKQPGDVVTITIRFVNSGDQPLSQLAISDHLSPRLEYVPGSSQTNRAANFFLMEQEDGTQLLRWELVGDLFPGQSGVIRFQARIR
jgi:uncharacterized repeat protein (TIGR01451 family)